ncbi:hypothetical protein SAMN05216251_102473 [Actinacidiphila alni]|uniref:Uncharacterized protein n=1 Tax=Actinacidiphila alni TaxID=380248 RepID=A0A1I1ZIZ4_9ACTN|nr:hypothetical protein [Actinacidiphila alni]SFE31669.1 hypothetical protein SAMN05216251_102473 [Actinacidiphila alni]
MTATLLEQRYRAVLRLLPAYYRRAREEEMVETFLLRVGVAEDGAEDEDEARDLDLMRPSWREVGSVVTLAVRSRMGAAGAPSGYVTLGGAVRHFALFALLLQAAATVTEAALSLAWSSRSAYDRSLLLDVFTSDGGYGWARGVALWAAPPLWTAAYATLLRQRPRGARLFAVAAAVAASEPLVDEAHWSGTVTALTVATAVFGWLTVLAVCCGFHADAGPAWLPAVPPGLAFLGTCVLMGGSVVIRPEGVDSQWATGTAFAVAAAACLAARALAARTDRDRNDRDRNDRARTDRPRNDRPAAETTLALAALGLVVLTLRAGLLAVELDVDLPAGLLAGAVAQLAVTVLLVAALAAVGARDLRAAPRTG